jgi:hypothetical protein
VLQVLLDDRLDLLVLLISYKNIYHIPDSQDTCPKCPNRSYQPSSIPTAGSLSQGG